MLFFIQKKGFLFNKSYRLNECETLIQLTFLKQTVKQLLSEKKKKQ